MKINIKIKEIENKTSKKGDSYRLVKASDKIYSVWDNSIELSEGEYEVETTEKKGFKQIISAVPAQPAQPQMLVQAASPEPKFRLNIKQLASGKHSWEVTIRANTEEEAKDLIVTATNIAKDRCDELNPAMLIEEEVVENEHN